MTTASTFKKQHYFNKVKNYSPVNYNFVKILMNFALLLVFASIFLSSALGHITSEDTFVRVISANEETRTYTLSCRMYPENNFLRDWFIRPDNGDTADDAEEAQILDKPSGEYLTYTFKNNSFYHVGCIIVDQTNFSKLYRGDLHIDLRKNSWNPEIVPVGSDGLSSTFECRYSNSNYSASWEVINAQTHQRGPIGTGKTIAHSVTGHGLYDYICHATADGVTRSTGLPVEYFDQGAPYFPDNKGIPDGITNTWIRNTTSIPQDPSPTPTPNGTGNTICFKDLEKIPASCEGGSITSDLFSGGARKLACSSESNSLAIEAWDKPTNVNPSYFEIYRKSYSGSGIKICIGKACISDRGYAKSSDYPICTENTTIPPIPPSPSPDNETPNATQSECYSVLESIPSSCNGGSIVNDNFNGCRNIVCNSGDSSLEVLACNKPNGSPLYYEMYKQVKVGSNQIEICLLDTCIRENGYAKSPNYPVCISGSSSGPKWLEPSLGNNNVDVVDFHIQVFPMQGPDEEKHVATDFEMWDVAANQRVWSSLYNTKILYHIHNADGNFENNLAGQNQLLYEHEYKLRARFYFNSTSNAITQWSEWRHFKTKSKSPAGGSTLWTARPGYSVQLIASDISMPVNIAIAPDLYGQLPQSQQPLLYVTQLYGQIGLIKKNGEYVKYADNLLNYASFGSLPGSGETGVVGLYVDPVTGDLFVSMAYYNGNELKGKVDRFVTNDDGTGYTSTNNILSNIPIAYSHQVQSITRGPDGKLYLNVGDADDPFGAKDISKLSGKILRFNDDGTIPSDNPYPGSYVYASGFRNPFGAAWKPGTNELFVTENGPDSNDSILKVSKGSVFGWCCNTALNAWHQWPHTTAPVQLAFDSGNFGFPQNSNGSLYSVLSGSTYSSGPSNLAKRIVQFNVNPNGDKSSVEDFVTYTGTGYSAPIGLAFGNDGLYFTDIYGESGFVGVGKTKGNIYKAVYGELPPTNETTPGNFSVSIAPQRWYPQGLDMVWVCKAFYGSGQYYYDFYFGDGASYTNMQQDNTFYKYPKNGTYLASCTAHDKLTGKTATGTTTLVLGNAGNNTATNQSCYNNVQNIPPKCIGGQIIQDTFTGCRNIVCSNGSSNLNIMACNKPDDLAQYFEMYKQNQVGTLLEICIGETCIKESGYAKSSNFPICIGSSPQDSPSENQTEEVQNATQSITLSIAQWYPKGRDYVFKCNANGFSPTSYDWSFGDGNFQFGSSSNDVYYVYSSPGEFNVSCAAKNLDMSKSAVLNINVS